MLSGPRVLLCHAQFAVEQKMVIAEFSVMAEFSAIQNGKG
jgi:hypothetical protein